jgi:hypothetical protein
VTLASNDTSEATVPATVTIPAGQSTSAPFDIDAVDDAIVDGTQVVTVSASAAAHAQGSDTLDVTDDDAAALTLAIAASSVSEGAGAGATTATVSRNTDTTNALEVTLASNDTSEATVPSTVTIAAGQSTSPAFNIDAVNDAIVDGTQTVTVTATAAAHTDGTDALDVTDDDAAALTVLIVADDISENGGATTATVSRNSDTTNALTVSLASNDTTEATVPSTVTIPIGNTSAIFTISAVDDSIVDGTQTVTVTASAASHAQGSDTLDVTDDDLEANLPPVFTSPDPASFVVNEGELLEFTVQAQDPEGGNVSFQFANLPTGSSFFDNGDGTWRFSWTPDFSQAGVVDPQVQITAFDDETPPGRTDLFVDITVGNTNQPPRFVPAEDAFFTVDEGQLLEFVVVAVDDDGDPIEFSDGGIPAGASLVYDDGAGTASFSWVPGGAQAGIYDLTIVASDNQLPPGKGEKSIQITVGDVNQPPILDPIGNKTAEVDEPLTFLITADDPDGDNNDLVFGAEDLPSGAEVVNNNDGTATFNWTPDSSQTGETAPIEIYVVDNGVPAEEDFEFIVITVNATEAAGDIDGDGDVDIDDVQSVLAARNQPASGPDDPRDLDGDGVITVLDARIAVISCTRPQCATE